MLGSISNNASTVAADESLSFNRYYFLPEIYLGFLVLGSGVEIFGGETETVVSNQRFLKKYTGILWTNRVAFEFSPKRDLFLRPTFNYRFGTFLAEGEAGRYRLSSIDIMLQMGFRF